MIELYTWDMPNGRKISVALEETGLPYQVKTVDITKREQFDPSFLARLSLSDSLIERACGVHRAQDR